MSSYSFFCFSSKQPSNPFQFSGLNVSEGLSAPGAPFPLRPTGSLTPPAALAEITVTSAPSNPKAAPSFPGSFIPRLRAGFPTADPCLLHGDSKLPRLARCLPPSLGESSFSLQRLSPSDLPSQFLEALGETSLLAHWSGPCTSSAGVQCVPRPHMPRSVATKKERRNMSSRVSLRPSSLPFSTFSQESP